MKVYAVAKVDAFHRLYNGKYSKYLPIENFRLRALIESLTSLKTFRLEHES